MEENNDSVLRELTEQSEEIFFIYDPHRKRFTYVNTAFEQITRKSTAELYENPLPLLDIIHPEDRTYVKENFEAFDNRTTISKLDFRIIRPDQTERWLRLKVYPIVQEGQVRYITGIAEDDSTRKATIFNLEKVSGWKDAVLEIIAHDLKGPVGVISMLTSAISKNLPPEEYRQSHEWLKTIDNIVKRNLEMIHNLLDRESLETAGVAINKERLDLVWELREVMQVFGKSQQDIGKKFAFTHSDEHIYAEADSMKFIQIVNNLVSNAIKFTKDDGLIRVHLEKLEKSALLTVEDNGIGIPVNLQPYLFNKRTQAGRKGVNGEESAGLGMWIVKTLVDAHGGKVWFESAVQKGSKFYVEIPLGM